MDKFIKWCVSILPKPLQKIYYKYEEKWLYLIFGVLTTVVRKGFRCRQQYRCIVDMRGDICVCHEQALGVRVPC